MKNKINALFGLFKDFKNNCREFSFNVAVAKLIYLIPFIPWEKRKTVYEHAVYSYLNKELSDVIDNIVMSYDENKCEICRNKRIWVMWWQGEESMPPIVKACYNQLNRVADDCEIVLLTKENISTYVDIPQYISEKLNAGLIGMANFSDIVRVKLLKKYGGAWFDSTLFVSDVPDDIFKNTLYTINAEGIFPDFISRGAWQPYFLCTNKTNTLFFLCLSDMFDKYWNEHNTAIDYLFVDYSIKIISEKVEEVHQLIAGTYKNKHLYDLNLAINSAYSEDAFHKMLEDCPIQKLTYRKALEHQTEDGKMTNYSYIIREYGSEFIN